MVVPALADLHELDPPREVVDHLLVALVRPPLDRVVELAAGGEEPERTARALLALDAREPLLLGGCDVDVSLEERRPDGEAEPLVQELDEAVEEVVRRLVAAVDERVLAVDDRHAGLVVAQRRD